MTATRLRDWFAPQLIALHLFAVAAIAACIAGGLWQYSSYDLQRTDQRIDASAAVPLSRVWSADEPLTGPLVNQRVAFTGTFESADQQFWVRAGAGGPVDGAWLVAPVRPVGSSAVLLVVRGLAGAPGALPPVPDGAVDLTVSLRPSDASTGPLDADRTTGSIAIPALINELPFGLWSGFGISLTDTGADLPLVAAPEVDVSWTVGLRNLAYALQWWVFAAFALFMWWRMSRDLVVKVNE